MKTDVTRYIQKLLVFIILSSIGIYSSIYIPLYVVIPALLFILSFIHERITDEKPPYLFSMTTIDEFINTKGGFWNFFKILVNLFGMIYDIVVRVVWGIYVLFFFLLDIISLIKEILYWIIHAIIWFLKLLVPPIIFLYKTLIHYFIKWIWWIYQLTFKNIGLSVNFNYLVISYWGSAIALFAVFIFYYLDVLVGTTGLIYIGVVLATLPLSWAFGEISSTREQNLEEDDYSDLTTNFENGFESVKWMLYFILGFLALFIIQVALDLLGWMPSVGLSVLGLTLNINTLISIILIILFILIVFATMIIPTHLLNSEEQESWFYDILEFTKVILQKGIRYILSLVPSGFYGMILMIIPGLFVYFSFYMTNQIKNEVIDRRINHFTEQMQQSESERQSYEIRKKIEKLSHYQSFPENIMEEAYEWRNIENQINQLNQNISQINQRLSEMSMAFQEEMQELNNQLEEAQQITNEEARRGQVNLINDQKNTLQEAHEINTERYRLRKFEYQQDKLYWQNIKMQLPFVLFFGVIWIAVFGGLVLAFYVSYIGNVFYQLYGFRESGEITYFSKVIDDLNQKDNKQPLLGFTCLILMVAGIIVLIAAIT